MIEVSAIVVAYGSEPWLQACVDSILASTGAQIEVIVVDNGDTSGVVDQLVERGEVTVVRAGSNTGFTGGCNTGAEAARGNVLALVNPDVIVEPTALAVLAAAAAEPGVGIATSSLRLADAPELLNSAGNPVHYLGLAWAGAFGEAASQHAIRVPVASASGACCAIRRTLWDELGGFEIHYFAYHEDVELSLRCWQRGLDVVYIPDAVAWHHYEFARNDLKNYLLERNRLLTVTTLYSARTLALLAPALIGVELLLLVMSAAQGWLPAKLSGYRWLVLHRRFIRSRRTLVQSCRIRSDRELAHLLSARFEPANVPRVRGLWILNGILALYWNIVRRLL